MFTKIPADPTLSKRHIAHAFVMSFTAGLLNVGALLACGRFVSHITGFATLFGSYAGRGRWMEAFEILSVPIFFLLGSMASAFFYDRPLRHGRRPNIPFLFGLITLCIFAAAGFGTGGLFGPFDQTFYHEADYLLLALLCLACGGMNGFITSASRGTLRSTHLSGLVTDLGIGLVRVLTPSEDTAGLVKERRLNALRLGTLFFFASGSLVGAYGGQRYQYGAFFIPATIMFLTTVYAILYKVKADV